jgi:hypothetical protein
MERAAVHRRFRRHRHAETLALGGAALEFRLPVRTGKRRGSAALKTTADGDAPVGFA